MPSPTCRWHSGRDLRRSRPKCRTSVRRRPRLRAWEDRLGQHDRLRVGLVWSGNPAHQNDHNRSIALHMLAPVLDSGASFVSLQKGVRDSDRPFLAGRSDIIDLTEHLTDFSETAALMSCLDLVIAVDTSVAHLAGALGRPVWIWPPSLLTSAGCSIAMTAPGIRPRACSDRTPLANGGSVIERVRVELGDARCSLDSQGKKSRWTDQSRRRRWSA